MNGEPTSRDEHGELQALRKRVAELQGSCEALQQTVKELQEKAQRYRDCVEQAPFGVLVADGSGRYQEVNPAACTMTGYSRTELLNMSVSDLLTPDGASEGSGSFDELSRNGSVSCETSCRKKDGTRVGLTFDAKRTADGGFIGFCMETTKGKKAENDRLEYIVDNCWDVIFQADLEGNYIFSNKSGERISGYSLEELSTMNRRELIAPEYHEEVFGRIKRRIAGESVEGPCTFQIIRKDGQRAWIELNTTGVYENGKLVGIQGISRDITERKQTEEALDEDRKWMELILQHTTDGISVVEVDPRTNKRWVVMCNDRFVEMSGRSREELMGTRDLQALRRNLDTDNKRQQWLERKQRGLPYSGTGTWIRPDGKENYDEWTATPVRIEGKQYALGIERDVTEKKRVERELRQSKEHLQSILDNCWDIISRADLEGNYTFNNKGAERITGYSVEELSRMNRREMIAPEYHEEVFGRVQRRIAGESIEEPCTFQIIRKDGERAWVELNTTGVYENGKLVGIQGIARDITERKQAEETLTEHRRRTELILQNSYDGINICELDLKTGKRRLVMCNDRYVEMSGRTREELMGADNLNPFSRELTRPEEKRRQMELKEKCLPYRGLSSWKRPDGRENYYEWTAAPIDMEDKRLLIGIDRDVTEQRLAQEALQESEATGRALLNAAAERALLRRADGTILALNEAAAQAFGKPVSELVGKNTLELVPPELAKQRKVFHDKAIRQRKPVRFQDQRDGRWLDHNLYPVPDAQGNITRLAVFTQDVTEQRLAEEALRESEERYRTLVEAMSEGVLMHKDDRMAYVNDSFCEMLGYSPDELAKIRPGTLIDDEDRKRLSKRLDEPTPSKRTTYGVKWRKKDGTKLPTMTSLRHIYDAAGQLSGAVAVVTDISLQMQAEKALRTSEERYRSFFENSPISLWELDFSEAKNHIDTLRGRRIKDLGRYLRNHPELLKEARRIVNITDVNQATLDLLQAESKEKVLHSAGPFLTKASRKAFDDVLISLIEGDTSVECESEVITGKGEIRYVVARLSLIPTYRDTWEKVLVSVVDITDRRRAEQALRESEQHYRELFENAPMPVFEEDCTESPPVILRANRRAEETYGCSFEEQTPFPVKQLVPSTNLNDYEGAKKMLMAGKSVVLETKNIRPDGSVFPVRVSATVSPTSGPKRTIVMVEDITDQERVREILHTANQRLVQAREQEWRRLAGDLHDSIGQGLVALKLHLQNAATAGKARNVKTLSNAKAEPTNMCDALIREVRSMCYRLYPPALESVGLLGAMRQLIDQARQKMRVTMQCRAKIRTARFPAEPETALFRITQEALNNAMRHSQAEHVDVELSHNKGVITLKISDNGVGFDKDEALGRGLGLNTMRERAYAAGGDIKITSSRGKTVIRATIPAEPVPVPGK